MSCHGLQTKIAAVRRDEEGWQNCVALMRDRANGVGDLRITEEDGAAVASYLGRTFSPDSDLPRSPADLPGYPKAKHAEFSDEAMKIVYVLYDLPKAGRIPWVAYPQKDGSVWMPHSWTADQIAKAGSADWRSSGVRRSPGHEESAAPSLRNRSSRWDGLVFRGCGLQAREIRSRDAEVHGISASISASQKTTMRRPGAG